MEKFEWAPEKQILTNCRIVVSKGKRDTNPLTYFGIEKGFTREQKIAIVDKFGAHPYSYAEQLNTMYKQDLDKGVIKSRVEIFDCKIPNTNSVADWLKKYDTRCAFHKSLRNSSVFVLNGFGYIKPYLGSDWGIGNTVKSEYSCDLPYSDNPDADILDQMCNYVLQKLCEQEVEYFNEHDRKTVFKIKCKKEVRSKLLWVNETVANFVVNNIENEKVTLDILEDLLEAEGEIRTRESEQIEFLKAKFRESGL